MRNPTLRHTRHAGFTLIEILVVVVILGILAGLVIPNVMQKPEEAQKVKVKQDIRSLEAALDTYKLDNYVYPSTDQGLEALVSKPSGAPEPRSWKGPYTKSMQKDPWDRPYLYLNPGVHSEIDIYSLGRDGQQGGEGIDADAGNWTQTSGAQQ